MSNEHKLSQEMSSVLDDVGKILNGDRPTTHGDIAYFAVTFAELHAAYIQGMMRARRNPTPLDSYAIQVIQKLARIANSAPEHAEPHFIDIAGYAVAGTAHTRSAAAAQAMAAETETMPNGERMTRTMAPQAKREPGEDLVIPAGTMVPPGTPVGTHVWAQDPGDANQDGAQRYLGVWGGPDMGLQGGLAPKG